MYIFLRCYRNCRWLEQEANAYKILVRNLHGKKPSRYWKDKSIKSRFVYFSVCILSRINVIIIVFISVNTTNYVFNM
jgi:hypothetical protein